jgi:hypothetical protein
VGIEDAALVAHEDDFAGLIGGDDQADVELLEEGRQVGGMDAAQGGVGGRRRHDRNPL